MTIQLRKTKGRKPQFTPKQVERMMHMRYVENLRCREIAVIMGSTPNTVVRYTKLRETEIPLK
jgi:DNA-binding CsgD family transcriptional regulator